MTTRHDVALLRLVAQRVAGPPDPDPLAVVRRLGAVQAQDLPGAVTSVALRTAGRDRGDVLAALDAGAVVRTWPMRGTLHLVPADDVRWMLALMTSRPRAAAATRRRQLDLTEDHLARARDVVVGALRGGGRATRAQLLGLWEEGGVPVDAGRGYHVLAHLAQTGVLVLGPTVGDSRRTAATGAAEQAVVLLDEWVPATAGPDDDAAAARLAVTYFRGHGPATVPDLARWSGLPLGTVRRGLAAVAGELTTITVEGAVLHLDPATLALLDQHRDAARGVHLLPGFDEVVLGYADRSVTVPVEHAARIVPGNNGMFRATVLAEGVVVGTWRASTRGGVRQVEVEPFTELAPSVAEAVPGAAARLP
ncbi:winged helix DNA-binding domain-containing protein [uncultured Cellulomonas sp.]|uniref:winged helix DNA-binding domain-containing protein n=1 Tax=uncultured Cellulomonas sp. TaxID=189682 RepID=UPI002616AA59|nr:winged helix DNA-binding domain-containing protein [uncultured Cellulomonas sp.]